MKASSLILMISSWLVVCDAIAFADESVTAPKHVRVSASSPAHLHLEWEDESTNESGFRIWRRRITTKGPMEWHLAGEVAANVESFDDGGLNHQTEYEHKVVTLHAAGESAATHVVQASRTSRMTQHLEAEIVIGPAPSAANSPAAMIQPDGGILLAYGQSSSIWLRRSADGGRTWSEPDRILQGSENTPYIKPSLVKLPNNYVGLSCSHLTYTPGNKVPTRKRLFLFSADGAEPWTVPVLVGRSSANNSALILGDRRRLLEPLNDGRYRNALIAASDDLGKSWRIISEVSVEEKALPTGEACLAHAGSGKIVFLSRQEAPFYCLQFSDDNGLTWGGRRTLWLGGGDNPPKIVTIPGTKYLLAVVSSWYDGAKAKDRRQIASLISEDDGRTWSNFRLIGFAPKGDDGFVQYSLCIGGDTAYLFFGAGTRGDTEDCKDLRMIRLHRDFFLSKSAWPYDWQGLPIEQLDRTR